MDVTLCPSKLHLVCTFPNISIYIGVVLVHKQELREALAIGWLRIDLQVMGKPKSPFGYFFPMGYGLYGVTIPHRS